MADHIKRIIDDYYKHAPWYDINGDEISLDDFINIYEEERKYEEKQKRRRVYQNDVTNHYPFSRKNS